MQRSSHTPFSLAYEVPRIADSVEMLGVCFFFGGIV